MSQTATCMVATTGSREMTCEIHDGGLARTGFVVFLFAIFCAYWALRHGRNAWIWFFLGLFLAPVTGLVLLYYTSRERGAVGGAA